MITTLFFLKRGKGSFTCNVPQTGFFTRDLTDFVYFCVHDFHMTIEPSCTHLLIFYDSLSAQSLHMRHVKLIDIYFKCALKTTNLLGVELTDNFKSPGQV